MTVVGFGGRGSNVRLVAVHVRGLRTGRLACMHRKENHRTLECLSVITVAQAGRHDDKLGSSPQLHVVVMVNLQ